MANNKVIGAGSSTSAPPVPLSPGEPSAPGPEIPANPPENSSEEKTATVASLSQEPADQTGFSPDGTLGSTPASVVLPSFDTLFITLAGGPTDFTKISPRVLDYVAWSLTSPNKEYLQTATFRYFHFKVFEPDTQPTVLPPDCKQEENEKGQVKVTCQGLFPQINGHMLRLVTCGVPNMEAIKSGVGNVDRPLETFVDRAWVRGDKKLWELDACPQRGYVDYVFYGPELQLVFPLEMGKFYMLLQFPKDYIQNMAVYKEPVPNQLGIHNRQYETNQLMGNFLYKGRIVQAIFAAPQAWMPPGSAGQEYVNIPFTAPPSGKGGLDIEGMPGNEVCKEMEDWDPAWSQLEIDLFHAINQKRAEPLLTKTPIDCGGKGSFVAAPPLDMAPTLRCSARYHSRDMDQRNFVSHINPDLQSDWLRIFIAGMLPTLPGELEGELYSQTGENIARGPATVENVVQQWLDSDEHCANLMNPNFTNAGVGYHPGQSSGPLWTIDFGTAW